MVKKKDSFKQLYVSVPAVSQRNIKYSIFSNVFSDIYFFPDSDFLQILICTGLCIFFLALSLSMSVLFVVLFALSLVLMLFRAHEWFVFQVIKKDFEENGIF
jgi:hypothetical protein